MLILQPDLSAEIKSKKVEAFTFEKHGRTRLPHALAFIGDGHLAAVASENTIDLLDTKEWKTVRTFEGPKDVTKTFKGKTGAVKAHVNCVAATPDGKLLAAGYGETAWFPGSVRIWEADTGKLVKELK